LELGVRDAAAAFQKEQEVDEGEALGSEEAGPSTSSPSTAKRRRVSGRSVLARHIFVHALTHVYAHMSACALTNGCTSRICDWHWLFLQIGGKPRTPKVAGRTCHG